jgi:hypothetical protein
MRLRSAPTVAALAILAALSGCTDEGYPITDLSGQLVVDPPFLGITPPAPPEQYTATIDGTPVPVTWQSSDNAVATVSPTGLVTVVDYGFAAITATLTSNTATKKSSSLWVQPPGDALASGIAASNIGGVPGDTPLFHIRVPAGATNLVFALSGGTGDLDLYTRFGAPPTYADWDCRPYLGGNAETCPHPNPAAGFWFAMIDVYVAGDGASLTATITAP